MGVLEVFSNPTGYNASYQLLVLVWLQAHVLSSPRPAFLKHGIRDNANPRCSIDELEKAGKLPAARIARIKRIIAAHQNSLDGLPLITAAIVSLANREEDCARPTDIPSSRATRPACPPRG